MNIRISSAAQRRPAAPLAPAQGWRRPATRPLALAPGQLLLHAGQSGPLWRVASGALRIECMADGAGATVQLALPGDCVGLEALLDAPYAVTASALVASTVCIEPVDDAAARLELLAQALRQQQRQAQDMARLRSGAVADRLSWLVDRLGAGAAAPLVRKALPSLREMAGVVGSAPETVCRELGRLLPTVPAAPRRVGATRAQASTLALA